MNGDHHDSKNEHERLMTIVVFFMCKYSLSRKTTCHEMFVEGCYLSRNLVDNGEILNSHGPPHALSHTISHYGIALLVSYLDMNAHTQHTHTHTRITLVLTNKLFGYQHEVL